MMIKVDRINFSAYKYAEAKHEELAALCSPLLKLNISTFAYFRFFPNGRYLYLCNHLDWVQFCLKNVHNNEGTSLGQEIKHALEDNYHCFLWPTEKTDYLMSALHDFNIWNGLSIFKQREDSIELWGFAANCNTENLQNFYIENIELLKKFTSAFNREAAEIIIPHDDYLAIYKDFKLQNPKPPQDDQVQKINEFITATSIDKYPIIVDSKEIVLTEREMQFVTLLVAGKNAKQIASQFNLSQRTVEKHFENVKSKMGYRDKESIFRIYKENLQYWL